MANRLTLRQVIMRQVGAVVVIATSLLAFGTGWLLHSTIHEQTDAMLRALARTEAEAVLSEYEHGVHVHDTAISLPSFAAPETEKFSAAFDSDCRVVAHTTNIADGVDLGDRCQFDDTTVFDTDSLADQQLRVASWPGESPTGQRYLFVVGVPHDRIDSAVWSTVALTVLLAVLLGIAILAFIWLVAGRISRDVHRLSDACETLESTSDISPDAFDVGTDAAHEIATLGNTVESLLKKWSSMIDVQADFLAEASHELRTPIAGMRGDIEVTLRRERTAEEYREALERVLQDTVRLSELSSRLLETARTRTEAIERGEHRLLPIIGDAVERNRVLLDESGLEVGVEGDDIACWVDPQALNRVLDNLIGNAAEHSGGQKLSLNVERRDDHVVIHVADDGDGMPEVGDDLLVPLRASGGGRGLGLYIARRLLERLGGTLKLADDQTGTHWLITLPIGKGSA